MNTTSSRKSEIRSDAGGSDVGHGTPEAADPAGFGGKERPLAEEFPDMVYATDGDDLLVTINNAGVRLLGYESSATLIGRPFSDFLYNPEDRQDFTGQLHAHGRLANYETVMATADGSPLYCLESAVLLRSGGRDSAGTQGTVRNITDRVMVERELWRRQLELAELNLQLRKTRDMLIQQERLATIGQMAAGIVHEVRNPLTALRSNLEYASQLVHVLDRSVGSTEETADTLAEMKQTLADCDTGIEHLTGVIKGLSGFSRRQTPGASGHGHERSTPATPTVMLDIDREIRNAVDLARPKTRTVAEVVYHPAPLPPVEGIEGGVTQVILNLVINAANAIGSRQRHNVSASIPDGSTTGKAQAPVRLEPGRIDIEAERSSHQVIITVSNNGPPVPEEVKDRLFEPFFTTRLTEESTGLGLSVSRDIIQNGMDGTIELDSRHPANVAFTITLPVPGHA